MHFAPCCTRYRSFQPAGKPRPRAPDLARGVRSAALTALEPAVPMLPLLAAGGKPGMPNGGAAGGIVGRSSSDDEDDDEDDDAEDGCQRKQSLQTVILSDDDDVYDSGGEPRRAARPPDGPNSGLLARPRGLAQGLAAGVSRGPEGLQAEDGV